MRLPILTYYALPNQIITYRAKRRRLLAGKKLCVSANVGARIGSSVTLGGQKTLCICQRGCANRVQRHAGAGKKLCASANVGARIGSSVTLGGQKTSRICQCRCANRVQRHAGRAKNFAHPPMWVRESGPASRWCRWPDSNRHGIATNGF